MRAALNWMVLAVILSGIGPVLVRDSPVDPASTAFWRMFLGLPFALLLIRRSIFLPTRAMVEVAIAGLLLAGDIICWNSSIKRTTILESTTLVMVYPVITVVASYLLFKERVGLRFVAGGGFAFVGMLLMMGSSEQRGETALTGDLLALAAACFYAVSLMISSRLCRAYNPLVVSFWLIFWAAVGAAPIGLMEQRTFPDSLHGWIYIVAYALLTLAGYSLFNRGLKVVPTSIASLMGYGQPVVAAVLGFFFLNEVPTWNAIVGGIVIVGGLVLATRPPPIVAAPKPAEAE